VRLVLALLAALALAGCGFGDSDETSAPATVTVTETVTTTAPAETETGPAEPAGECSAAGLDLTLEEQDLPEAVAGVRQRLFDAATACDYEALASLAGEEGFTFSFGGGDDPAAYWREVEEEGTSEPLPLRALATILTLPPTRNEAGSYAWPDAYSESPSDEAWQALVDAGLYTEEQVELMRTQGTGYLGYRTAITPEGVWQFFVAGD
jgi:hypothetical protein